MMITAGSIYQTEWWWCCENDRTNNCYRVLVDFDAVQAFEKFASEYKKDLYAPSMIEPFEEYMLSNGFVKKLGEVEVFVIDTDLTDKIYAQKKDD